ncbi:MAG: translation initiation factor IF-3 [Kiritimatiellae bacterium]|jgi:translation initiation factor IF-3|nr:translation initiation factor IF-3 [Kiritimatiellia bacterium]
MSAADRYGKNKGTFTRINQMIRAPEIRCLLPDGAQAGIMSLRDALKLSEERGLDLVEISPNAEPPVCRIMDYGKFKYEEGQRKKQAKKSQSKSVIKEVKFHANVDENDYQIKLRNIRGFLADGDKVKLTLQFRGRENAHREIGDEVMKRVCLDLADVAVVEQEPRLLGRAINGLLGPK